MIPTKGKKDIYQPKVVFTDKEIKRENPCKTFLTFSVVINTREKIDRLIFFLCPLWGSLATIVTISNHRFLENHVYHVDLQRLDSSSWHIVYVGVSHMAWPTTKCVYKILQSETNQTIKLATLFYIYLHAATQLVEHISAKWSAVM